MNKQIKTWDERLYLIELLREKPDSDGICREAADLLEAQSKQIAELEKAGNEWYEAHNKKRIQLAEQAKQIEALESEWRPTPCQETLHACITYLVHGTADFSGLPDGLVNTLTTKIEALQADAERYLWIVGSASISDVVDSEKQRTLIDNAWEKITECTDCAPTSKHEIDAAIDLARKGTV